MRCETPAATQLVGVVAHPAAHGPGTLDRGRIAALVGAVAVEDRRLLAEDVDRAERVPDVGVARDELERALHAAPADQDRDPVAKRRRVEPGEPRLDARQRLLKRRDALADRAEVVAVLVVVLPEPAGADAEDRAAAGDVVDRPVRVREVVRVAVAVAEDERAELDALGHLRHGAERRERLEVLPFRFAGEREEVIPVEQAVDAERLGLGPGAAHGGPVGVLGLELRRDADGRHARQ